MKLPRRSAWIPALVLSLTFGLATGESRAQEGIPAGTSLVVDVAPVIAPGNDHAFEIYLYQADGEPLPGQVVSLFLNDNLESSAASEDSGRVRLRLQSPLEPGAYTLRFDYPGSGQFAGASKTRQIQVAPVELSIHTTPVLAGLEFRLGDLSFHTGEDGLARIVVERAGEYLVQALPYQSSDSTLEADFRRWDPEYFTPDRVVHIQSDTRLEIGFDTNRLVNFAFFDQQARPIDPERITSLSLRASNGTVLNFEDAQPKWLLANRVVRRLRGLESVALTYSVQDVTIDGSNVVNRGQQSFLITGEAWPIDLLLFSARFTAQDVLFGLPLGSGVSLEYPDGSARSLPFNKEGELIVTSLARGEYHARVEYGLGISIPTPIVLSRDQDIVLKAISYPTMVLFTLFPAAIAVQILLIGRPGLRRGASRRISRLLSPPGRKSTEH